MGRKKVKHELISNESVRKVTFKKRKAGLLKKLSELTTLCGVVACAIIYSAFDAQPDVWPSPPDAFRVLEKFKDLPTKKQGKYMMDQKVFLMKNISKLEERLEKEKKKNRGLEMELILTECLAGKTFDDMSCVENLKDFDLLLTEKIDFITKKIECVKNVKSSEAIAKNENKSMI